MAISKSQPPYSLAGESISLFALHWRPSRCLSLRENTLFNYDARMGHPPGLTIAHLIQPLATSDVFSEPQKLVLDNLQDEFVAVLHRTLLAGVDYGESLAVALVDWNGTILCLYDCACVDDVFLAALSDGFMDNPDENIIFPYLSELFILDCLNVSIQALRRLVEERLATSRFFDGQPNMDVKLFPPLQVLEVIGGPCPSEEEIA
ncbi:hypothetical protein F5I97DRAFT_1966013 [Phlebopus sp. FC_14]|nr:hypothetical protein F5I97DRAFT_1966013 [Phlebopus sp. FC_14]